jgi:hypothetical protein
MFLQRQLGKSVLYMNPIYISLLQLTSTHFRPVNAVKAIEIIDSKKKCNHVIHVDERANESNVSVV